MSEHVIVDFLVRRFSEEELRRLVRHHYQELAADLPGAPSSQVAVADSWVQLLVRTGKLDGDFFALLRHVRERFVGDIDALERVWMTRAVGATAPTTQPTAFAKDSQPRTLPPTIHPAPAPQTRNSSGASDTAVSTLQALIRLEPQLAAGGATEASTRLMLIDRILSGVLGWDLGEFNPEDVGDGVKRAWLDYHLTSEGVATRRLVVESKSVPIEFQLPTDRKPPTMSLHRLMNDHGDSLKDVIAQALDYCSRVGTLTFVATNGSQWIASASALVGIPRTDIQAVIFYSVEDILARLDEFRDLLSPDGLEDQNLMNRVSGGKARTPNYARSLHQLLSTTKVDDSNSKNYLARPLRRLMHLCFRDLTDESHQDMLQACYVSSNATDAHLEELDPFFAGKLPSILQAEADVEPVDRTSWDPAEAMFRGVPRRGVSLVVGPAGSGKSTFFAMLKTQISRHPSDRAVVYLHVDLINSTQLHSENFDHDRLIDTVCGDLLTEAESTYPKFSPYEFSVLREVFAGELRRLRTARSPESLPPSPEDENRTIAKHLERRKEHLKAWLGYIVREKCPVIVVLDNVDQGTVAFEKVIYQFAADLAHKTDASIAVSMRGTTFERGMKGGFLDVRLPTVLQIEPPPFAEVATKRVEYIRSQLKDDTRLAGQFKRDMHGFEHERVLDFIEILAVAVLRQPPARECITSLAGGNIRTALELVERYSTSAHTDINTLFRDYEASQGKGWASPITLDSFLRSVMKGEHWQYSESRSPIVNLFRGARNTMGARFASIRVLQFLDWASLDGNQSTDVSIRDVIGNLGKLGYEAGLIERAVNFLGRRRLVVSMDRLEPPWARESLVRIGSSGRYYIHEILRSREYFAACVFDMLLYSQETAMSLEKIYRKSSGRTWDRVDNVVRRCVELLRAEELQEMQPFAAHGTTPVWAVAVMSADKKGR